MISLIQRPTVVEVGVCVIAATASIDIGSLLGSIPDHRSFHTPGNNMRATAIERCDQAPGILYRIIHPHAIVGYGQASFPASRQDEQVIFTIPRANSPLAWARSAYANPRTDRCYH